MIFCGLLDVVIWEVWREPGGTRVTDDGIGRREVAKGMKMRMR